MIDSFEIKKFRLFNNVKIKNFKNVNLIVGKNNAGKSALLEALLLYFSKVSSDVILEILFSRQENWESGQSAFNQQQIINPLKHFFENHKIPEPHETGFTLSSKKNNDQVYVKTTAYIVEETDNRVVRREAIDPLKTHDMDEDLYELYLVAEINRKSSIIMSFQDDFENLKRRNARRNSLALPKKSSVGLLPYQFVPTQGMDNVKVSALWDSISLTDMEKEVIKGLQLIEADVTGITFVQSPNSHNDKGRIPLVKLKGLEWPVSLKSLGDGMTHIFQIILSLVSAKNGVLIVDEFENGLHWSIQEDVWNIIFSLASTLNVQVFATTHSRDCIIGFEKAWKRNENKGSFLRIKKENHIALVKEYDLELLSDSIETDVEIR